ncbi:MAG: GlsB/YeaQ/YmgE family stress response membrane protein [Pseudonocardiaceae bacterium]
MEISGVLTALVVGAVLGVLGRLVVPGRQPIGCLLTIAVGIVAALAGTAIAEALDVAVTPGIDWLEVLIQVVAAALGVSAVATFLRRR